MPHIWIKGDLLSEVRGQIMTCCLVNFYPLIVVLVCVCVLLTFWTCCLISECIQNHNKGNYKTFQSLKERKMIFTFKDCFSFTLSMYCWWHFNQLCRVLLNQCLSLLYMNNDFSFYVGFINNLSCEMLCLLIIFMAEQMNSFKIYCLCNC